MKIGNTGKTFEMLLIDTVILSGNSDILTMDRQSVFDPVQGPAFGHVALAAAQWNWIETALSKSKADYLWVAGHYPIYSACSHGPTRILVDKLMPLLKKYNAHYLSGHDHCQEYFEDQGVSMVLTGTGDNCCYDATKAKLIPKGAMKYLLSGENAGDTIGGFASFEFTANSSFVKFYDQDGKVQYTTPNILPRKKREKLGRNKSSIKKK